MRTKPVQPFPHSLSVVELGRLGRNLWSQSGTVQCDLPPWSLRTDCSHSPSASIQILRGADYNWWLYWGAIISLSTNNSSSFSKMLSEKHWLRRMKDFRYKRGERCFSWNPPAQLTASLEAALQNKPAHRCRSSRLPVAARVLIQLCYLGDDNVVSLWLCDSSTLKGLHVCLLQVTGSISNASSIGSPRTDESLHSVGQKRPKSKWCLSCQWEPDFAQLSVLLTPEKLNLQWQWWENDEVSPSVTQASRDVCCPRQSSCLRGVLLSWVWFAPDS